MLLPIWSSLELRHVNRTKQLNFRENVRFEQRLFIVYENSEFFYGQLEEPLYGRLLERNQSLNFVESFLRISKKLAISTARELNLSRPFSLAVGDVISTNSLCWARQIDVKYLDREVLNAYQKFRTGSGGHNFETLIDVTSFKYIDSHLATIVEGTGSWYRDNLTAYQLMDGMTKVREFQKVAYSSHIKYIGIIFIPRVKIIITGSLLPNGWYASPKYGVVIPPTRQIITVDNAPTYKRVEGVVHHLIRLKY